jgi:superfamily II DNA or RNA helicase
MGAPNILKLLKSVHLEKRIGLSATPNRQYDLIGNKAIQDFYNDTPPFVYSYSMKEALNVGWLCKYTYHPHIVYLTPDELKEYLKISKQLLKFIDFKTGRYKECKEVEILLLKRKRIIHKASNKLNKFNEILQSEFEKRNNLNYTLVYVPEGLDPNYSIIDEYVENSEEIALINQYTRAVSQIDDSIMVKQYTSKTKNRDDVINDFEKGEINVLTSMKCLDEGVDVPRSELAVFCASTGNPRQFIQRRGRVLRLHDDKIFATIHDLVVVPTLNMEAGNYDMERNLLKKELERVVDFSQLSMNKADTHNELIEVLDYYNLNLNDLITK